MSFLRHGQIYQSDVGVACFKELGAACAAAPSAHRLDEFAAGYSSAGCSPAVNYQTDGLDKTGRNRIRASAIMLE